jgi:DNA-binding response OmpR family regulator
MSAPDKPLVLVVDDMPEGAQMLRMYIEEAGYEVQVAHDGLDALALARVRLPALAVCDVVLPSMLGWELCLKLKELAAPKTMPVIMLTAKTTEIDEIRSYESHADDHFRKPADFKQLIAAIHRHVPLPASK